MVRKKTTSTQTEYNKFFDSINTQTKQPEIFKKVKKFLGRKELTLKWKGDYKNKMAQNFINKFENDIKTGADRKMKKLFKKRKIETKLKNLYRDV